MVNVIIGKKPGPRKKSKNHRIEKKRKRKREKGFMFCSFGCCHLVSVWVNKRKEETLINSN